MDEKEIRWSKKAIQDKIDILDYWIKRNKSKSYSQKLDLLFNKIIRNTARAPETGKKTDYRNVQIKIISHYMIFYRIQEKYVEIVRIWDSRRDPNKMKL